MIISLVLKDIHFLELYYIFCHIPEIFQICVFQRCNSRSFSHVCISVVIQFLSPTAPPWFNDSAVFDEHGNVLSSAPNEAAFQRVDALLGFPCFHNIYG